MEKLVLPLLMYKEKGSIKKGTKRSQLVVPTWNHLYIRRGNSVILDQWVEKHVEKMADLTENWIQQYNWEKTENKKVIVNCHVYWNDAKKKDCHNVLKLHMDVFNDRIYDDDCNALLRIMDFDIDLDEPRLEFTFEVKEHYDRKERKKELTKIKKQAEKEAKAKETTLEKINEKKL